MSELIAMLIIVGLFSMFLSGGFAVVIGIIVAVMVMFKLLGVK